MHSPGAIPVAVAPWRVAGLGRVGSEEEGADVAGGVGGVIAMTAPGGAAHDVVALPIRWAKADGPTPGPGYTRRLQLAYRAWTHVAGAEGDHVARAWFLGGNPVLGETTPLTAIRTDRGGAHARGQGPRRGHPGYVSPAGGDQSTGPSQRGRRDSATGVHLLPAPAPVMHRITRSSCGPLDPPLRGGTPTPAGPATTLRTGRCTSPKRRNAPTPRCSRTPNAGSVSKTH